MMGGQGYQGGIIVNRNKLQKKKEREERLRKQRHFESVRNLYPQFCFVNEHICDPDYVNIVKNAVKDINFQTFKFHDSHDYVYHEFLKNIVKHGFKPAFFMAAGVTEFAHKISRMDVRSGTKYLMSEDPEVVEFNKRASNFASQHENLLIAIGDNILFSKGKEGLFKYWPNQGFRICFVDDRICFVFQRINKTQHNNNTCYHYMVPNKIKWNNKEYEMYFTHHAMQRIIKRFSNRGKSSYCSFILLYEFFNNMRHKIAFHAGGRQFVQFYFPVFSKLLPTVKKIVESEKDLCSIHGHIVEDTEKRDVYVKCFSSPLDVDKNIITIITALLPGYHPTPESHTFTSPGIKNMKEKDRFRHLYFSEVDITSDDYVDAFQFFHNNGVSQVFVEKSSKETNPFRIRNFFDHEKMIYDKLT
jgi:hypothetical protein